jgi:hypothetical protein
MTRPTSDDHPPESTDERDRDIDDREQWLRENVPPHHI